MADYFEIEESFWGVCLEHGKKYSQIVDKSVHVSMAAIDPSAKGSKEATSLWISKDSVSYLICSLGHPTFQQHLDLNFNEGETVTLFTKGNGTIHLTGYLHLDTDFASDDDDFIDGEAGEQDDDVDDDEAEEELEEVKEPKIEAVKKRKLGQKVESKAKKSKVQVDADDDDDDDDDLDGDDDEEEEEKPVKASPKKAKKATAKQQSVESEVKDEGVEGEKKKRKRKKKKTSVESVEADNKPTPKKEGGGKKKIAEGGVVVENVKEGHGPQAVVGKNVKVYYTGKLESGKIFDAKTTGSPFSFKLGRKEVIAGWDAGLAGMKVGGKRKLTIPAKMGYGAQKLPSIPPNSTLVFDVELKAVK